MQVELPAHAARIRAAGFEPFAPEIPGQQFDPSQLIDALDGCIAVIAGDDFFTAEVFAKRPEMRILVKWGIGMDAIDHTAAAEYGVVVQNTPAVFGDEVADSAFGYLLSLARGHNLVDAAIRAGGWPKYEGVSLTGGTLGVIGHGSIGRATARRGLGFGMKVSAFDPYVTQDSAEPGVTIVELETLLRANRFVIVTCPLTDETFHLLNDERLGWMSEDAFLVNVARGPVIDEPALVRALAAGTFAGVGLDVFEVEPLPDNSPLRAIERVMLGAHNGSNTREGVARASAVAVDHLLRLLGSLEQGAHQ
jgi:D-3-phosphoglycerate dehydrogenase